MGPLSKALMLFAMNWLDAQLTLLWVHLNVATEGNGLMARLIAHSELSFVSVKLLIGAFAAYVLYRCSHFPIARRGLTLVLGIYMALMFVHAATGCVALGWQTPATVLAFVDKLPGSFFALFS